MRYVAGFLILGVGVLAVAAASAYAERSASRIIDRTISCPVVVQAGARQIEVSAKSGTRSPDSPRRWEFLASASVVDEGVSRSATLADVSAGGPRTPGPGSGDPPLGVNNTRCTTSNVRVPLSNAGLSGLRAPQTGEQFSCDVPRRVLVRVRGVFERPTQLRRTRLYGRQELRAQGVVEEGAITVRTTAGRRIALLRVVGSGRATLFVGPTCFPKR